MIGKITTGVSFYHCFCYCLEDKKNLSEEQKLALSEKESLQHKDRAEVLVYNSCFGNARELAKQFTEVKQLSSRVEKPVLHISLRLAPGETLSKDSLIEICHACAQEFKIDQNQYICVLHKDTRDQHIHIVANRVGYNGRAASLSNSYQRMANFCRKMEKVYSLQEVLSPRVFLPKEQRMIPRQDARKERLRCDIRNTLKDSLSYAEFEQKMKSLGYQVLKGRGISFIDDKKVRIKGSEIGFSLAKIERVLALNHQLKTYKTYQKPSEKLQPEHADNRPKRTLTATQKMVIRRSKESIEEHSPNNDLERERNGLLYELMKPESQPDYINPEFLKQGRKRRKRLRHGR